MSKIYASFIVFCALCLLGSLPQMACARLLEKVVCCPCPGHKNTESLSSCQKYEKVLKPFDFHLNVGKASFEDGVLRLRLKQVPEVVSDRPGMHEALETAQCVEQNIKRLGDEEVVYVLWQPATQGVVVFKGQITQSRENDLSIQVPDKTLKKGIEEILAFHKTHEGNDLEVAILSYAVMTKESQNAKSEKTQLHDRVNYFLMSEGPVKVQATRKLEEKYPYDITLKGVQDIIRIDVTGKREDLTPETFVENWSLGPNSFALNPPDGNFTLRLKNNEQVFNAMKFNGPPMYSKETDTFVLEGVYLEGANNKAQIPQMMQREGMMESVPDHRVGVFLDQKRGALI